MTRLALKVLKRRLGSSVWSALLVAALLFGGSSPARSAPPLPVVGELDLDRYMGTWHEIARYPNFFERNCARDVTAKYARNADGTIRVVNACRDEGGALIRAEGVARVVGTGKLEVRFAPAWLAWLPLVWGDYWVIGLGLDYSYAVVGAPSREYLWILARDPDMDEVAFARITSGLGAVGFDPARLERSVRRPH